MNKESRRYSSPSESASRSSSRSRSRSRSESRSRGRTTTRSRSARTRTRSRSSSPQSRRSSRHTSKNYNTFDKKQVTKTSSQPYRIPKASSESSVNRNRTNVGQRRVVAKNVIPRQQFRPQTEQISQTAMRVMSAQRLKNNDLNNRLKELMNEVQKLREENKILNRVHKREERALKNLENQEHDVARMVRNHLDETNVLKEQIKKVKNDNKKLTATLIEKDEEIRAMKKRNEDMKKLLTDKKLFDNAELSKKLDNCESELASYKSKYELLERRYEMVEKNHKHELGVEIAHHREFQKQIQKLSDENKELKQLLGQKEKALDIANIYSNRAIKDNVPNSPQWKTSSQSLNHGNHESPRDTSNRRERSRKKETLPTKPPKPIKHEECLETERSARNELDAKLEQEKEEAEKRQKEFEAELRRKQENDAQEKAKRERESKEKEELRDKEAKRLQAEKLERENAKLEEEFKKKMVEEEKKRMEKQILEEEDRKKRWVSENTINKLNEDTLNEEKSKKDELLAKLALSSNKKSESDGSIFKLTAIEQSQKNELKKAMDEPKNELLSKLFGNTNSVNENNEFSNKKIKEINTMPWEDASFNKKASSNTPNSTQIQGLNFKENNDSIDFFSKLNMNKSQNGVTRPKLENKLLFPDIHKNNSYIEDIEELVL